MKQGSISFLKQKQNVPLVGCRANEIENLLTAEPRVVSEKEKNRYLKFITATKRRTFQKRKERKKTPKKPTMRRLEVNGMQKGLGRKDHRSNIG